VLVFLQWGWNYVTHDRSARLITGGEARDAILRGETETRSAPA
jgi:hypothetical protein